MKQIAMICVAVASSAALWLFGTGLHPVPGLAFAAPLPILLIAPRVGGRVAFAAGFAAWLGGESRMWTYLMDTLEQPPVIAVPLLVGSAALFGGLVAVTGRLLAHGRPVAGALVLPAGWVALEYVIYLTTPLGAWWNLAYTQADATAVIQVVSLTGQWGIAFLAMGLPAAVAAVLAPATGRAARVRLGAAMTVLVVLVMGYGTWRLAAPADDSNATAVRTGLLAVAQPPKYVPVDTSEGRDMIDRTVAGVERLADQGARVVVLPEKTMTADEATLAKLTGPLTRVAQRRKLTIVAGVLLTRGGSTINAAIELPGGGVYAKHHLIPGLEADLQPGRDYVSVPGRPWALAICFDLDWPDLVRENSRRGASLMLVPGLDFTEDFWQHSRKAVVRGVESGVGVARAAQLGSLVISDARGRVLAETRADVSVTRSVVADLPVGSSGPTVYSRLGDWYAIGCLILLAGLVADGIRRRIAPPPA